MPNHNPTHHPAPSRVRDAAILAAGIVIGALIGFGPARADDNRDRDVARALERIAKAQGDTAKAQADTARAVEGLGRRCK